MLCALFEIACLKFKFFVSLLSHTKNDVFVKNVCYAFHICFCLNQKDKINKKDPHWISI